jgi:hypothetical protein
MKTSIAIWMFAVALVGCAAMEGDELSETQGLSGAARRPRSAAIRDVAASRGLTNGVLLAGIGQVETGLSHCWSEATWACQGPSSSFCGGPVIAGASDGPCSSQQGGLGMFQFDGGTYQQTLARDGQAILQLDGNISHAVDFVAGIVVQEVAGVNTRAEAIAWMNSIPIAGNNARFQQWTAILACRYNGRCGSATQAAKYGDATLAAFTEFGTGFWTVAQGGGGGGFGADAEKIVAAGNAAGQLEVFWAGSGGAIQHAEHLATGWKLSALGGAAKELAIGNNADGRIELFYVGTNDQLFHRVQLPAGGWSAELPVGVTARDVALGRNSDGRLEAFYSDAGNAILHLWQLAPNGSWSGVAALGGAAKDLAVGNNADGRLELFYAGTDDRLYHRAQVSGGWSGEIAFGATAFDVAVGRNTDGRLEVFFTSGGNTVSHASQLAPNSGWSGVSELGGAAKQLVVGNNADGRLEVLYVGTNDQLFHRVQVSGGWSGEIAFGTAAHDLGVARNSDGRLELLYLTATGAIGHSVQIAPNSTWSAGSTLP